MAMIWVSELIPATKYKMVSKGTWLTLFYFDPYFVMLAFLFLLTRGPMTVILKILGRNPGHLFTFMLVCVQICLEEEVY